MFTATAIATALLVLAGIALLGTVRSWPNDGYRRVPTDRSRLP